MHALSTNIEISLGCGPLSSSLHFFQLPPSSGQNSNPLSLCCTVLIGTLPWLPLAPLHPPAPQIPLPTPPCGNNMLATLLPLPMISTSFPIASKWGHASHRQPRRHSALQSHGGRGQAPPLKASCSITIVCLQFAFLSVIDMSLPYQITC